MTYCTAVAKHAGSEGGFQTVLLIVIASICIASGKGSTETIFLPAPNDGRALSLDIARYIEDVELKGTAEVLLVIIKKNNQSVPAALLTEPASGADGAGSAGDGADAFTRGAVLNNGSTILDSAEFSELEIKEAMDELEFNNGTLQLWLQIDEGNGTTPPIDFELEFNETSLSTTQLLLAEDSTTSTTTSIDIQLNSTDVPSTVGFSNATGSVDFTDRFEGSNSPEGGSDADSSNFEKSRNITEVGENVPEMQERGEVVEGEEREEERGLLNMNLKGGKSGTGKIFKGNKKTIVRIVQGVIMSAKPWMRNVTAIELRFVNGSEKDLSIAANSGEEILAFNVTDDEYGSLSNETYAEFFDSEEQELIENNQLQAVIDVGSDANAVAGGKPSRQQTDAEFNSDSSKYSSQSASRHNETGNDTESDRDMIGEDLGETLGGFLRANQTDQGLDSNGTYHDRTNGSLLESSSEKGATSSFELDVTFNSTQPNASQSNQTDPDNAPVEQFPLESSFNILYPDSEEDPQPSISSPSTTIETTKPSSVEHNVESGELEQHLNIENSTNATFNASVADNDESSLALNGSEILAIPLEASSKANDTIEEDTNNSTPYPDFTTEAPSSPPFDVTDPRSLATTEKHKILDYDSVLDLLNRNPETSRLFDSHGSLFGPSFVRGVGVEEGEGELGDPSAMSVCEGVEDMFPMYCSNVVASLPSITLCNWKNASKACARTCCELGGHQLSDSSVVTRQPR